MIYVKISLIFDKNYDINPLSANPTKWSNILKQFVDNLLTICLSVFDHFVKLALKGLKNVFWEVLKIFQFSKSQPLNQMRSHYLLN